MLTKKEQDALDKETDLAYQRQMLDQIQQSISEATKRRNHLLYQQNSAFCKGNDEIVE